MILCLLLLPGCRSPTESPDNLYRSAAGKWRQGKYAESLKLARQGASSTQGVDRARFVLLQAFALLFEGTNEDARKLADSDPSFLRYPEIRARHHLLHARLLARKGDSAGCLARLNQVEETLQGSSHTETRIEAEIVRSGIYGRILREYEKSEEALIRAETLASQADDTYNLVAISSNRGTNLMRQGRLDEAAFIFQKILDMAKSDDTEVLRSVALNNFASVLTQLGDFDRAIAMRKGAVEFQQKAGLRDFVISGLGETGMTYLAAGRPQEGLPWLVKALDLAKQENNKQQKALWCSNLALALTETGDWHRAAERNREALQLREENGDEAGKVFEQLTSGRIAAAQGRPEDGRQAFEQVLAAPIEPHLRWEAYAGLSNLSRIEGATKLSRQYAQNALTAIEESTNGLRQLDSKITFQGHLMSFYRSYVRDLIEDGDETQAFNVADATHARLLAQRLRTSSAQDAPIKRRKFPSRAIPGNVVILSYWLAPSGSSVWAVSRQEVKRYSLPTQEQIQRLVSSHRAAIEERAVDPLATGTPASRALYDALVRPVQTSFPLAGKTVVIIPDGVLHSLNFESLIVSDPRPHYWIEDVTVAVAPSVNLLAPEEASPDRSMLLLGDPEPAEASFPKLRYASEEIDSLRRHFPATRTVAYTGANAKASVWKTEGNRSYEFIHFTAHASANPESPLDSAIILSPEGGKWKLYTREIAEARVNARLVTVSACRGAGARTYAGEGLIGFAWAFLQAGAQSVVAGLWDVSDRSTAELMSTFYRGMLEEKLSTSEALRHAKLALLHKGGITSKPYYWAPFQLYTRVYPRQNTNSH